MAIQAQYVNPFNVAQSCAELFVHRQYVATCIGPVCSSLAKLKPTQSIFTPPLRYFATACKNS